MFRPPRKLVALAFLLPCLLLAAGCKDYSEQIEAVQKTTVRDVANIGATRSGSGKKTLGEYVLQDIINEPEGVTWSAESTTLDNGTEAVTVIAKLAPGGWIRFTDRIDFHFRLDPAGSRVTFVTMEADGEPMLNSSGKPYNMSDGIRTLRDRWMAAAEAMTKNAVQAAGGDPNMVDMKMQAEEAEQRLRQSN